MNAPSPAKPPPAPAASPAAADLAALGVETNVNPEPPRAKFKEAKLKGEPETDRKLTLDGGVVLRERIIRVPMAADAVGAGPVGDAAFNLVITHALLTPEGEVAIAPDGGFRIKTGPHRHEISFDAERMGAMTDDAILAAELQQREVAAHKAVLFFAGLEKGDRLFGPRVSSTTQPATPAPAGD